ncbi:MAG: hypothetical protein AAF764_05805 [Pseudomonadota bacterium]
MNRLFALICALASTPILAVSAYAQKDAAEIARTDLKLELNKLATQNGNCRVTFVANNRTGKAIGGLGYEVVLFDTEGGVSRMTKFDFGSLAVDKTVVRRFDLAGTPCEQIGRILVNEASRCEADGIDCNAALATANRTDVAFGQ